MKASLLRLGVLLGLTLPCVALSAWAQGPDASAPAPTASSAAASAAKSVAPAAAAASGAPAAAGKNGGAAGNKGGKAKDNGAATTKAGAAAGAQSPCSDLGYDDAQKAFIAHCSSGPDAACWHASPAGGSVYQLQSGAFTCLNPLGVAKVPVTVDANGNMTFAGQKAAAPIHSIEADKTRDRPPVDFTKSVSLEQSAESSGTLFSAVIAGATKFYTPTTFITVPVSASAAAAPSSTGSPIVQPCPVWKAPNDGNAHLDIDLPRGSVLDSPDRNVLLPNQGLTVHVCYEVGHTVEVKFGGTRGLTSSLATNDETKGQAQAWIEGPAAPPTILVATSTLRFAPRQAGSADVTISVTSSGTNTTGTNTTLVPEGPLTVELEVDTLYWGAVRVGLGSLFDLGQNWHKYAPTTFAGSEQAEITQTHDPVGFEIVSGFAPYLFDLFCPGHGRSYTGGCNHHFAPYVGFGVVGTGSSQGIQALSSVHLGMELEFAKSFSIALTLVERRTQALNDGYYVGAPVVASMTASDVTHDDWRPGLAFVVNASPDFLQFAMGSGGSSSTNHSSTTTTSGTSAPAPSSSASAAPAPSASPPPADSAVAPPANQ